jgi:hypothetical protein
MPLSEEPGQMPELGMPTRPTAPDKSTNADRADAIEHSSQDARSMKSATDAVDSIPPVHDWHGSFTQRPSDQQMETRTASGDALLHAVSMFAAALLAPVVLLAGLYILLQRMKNQPAPIIRVEYVGGQPTIHNEQLLGLLQAAAQRQYKTQPELTPDSPEISSTAEQFELGPTYEEERVQREQQARQEEEGLLLKIYEDNLGMQRQLRERLAVAA